MIAELSQEQVENLLQGQWDFNIGDPSLRHQSFFIKENEILNITGFGDVEEADYSLSRNGDTDNWQISVPKFGWVYEGIMTLTEDTFQLFSPVINAPTQVDIKYKKQ